MSSSLPPLPAFLQPSVGPFANEYTRLVHLDPILAHHVLQHAVRILGNEAPAWRAAASNILASEPAEITELLSDEDIGGAEYVLGFARRALALARQARSSAAVNAACVAFAVAEGLTTLTDKDMQDAREAAQLFAVLPKQPEQQPRGQPQPRPQPQPQHRAQPQPRAQPQQPSPFPQIPTASQSQAPQVKSSPDTSMFPTIPGQSSASGSSSMFPTIPKKTNTTNNSTAAGSPSMFPTVPTKNNCTTASNAAKRAPSTSMFPTIPTKPASSTSAAPDPSLASQFPAIPTRQPQQPQQPQKPKPPQQPPASNNDQSSMFPTIPGSRGASTGGAEAGQPTQKPQQSLDSIIHKPAPSSRGGDDDGTEDKYAGPRKACKFAISALNFDDSNTAVTQILSALNQLTGKNYVPK